MYTAMFIGILTTMCLILGFSYVHLDRKGLFPRKYKKNIFPVIIFTGFYLLTAFIMEATIGAPPEGSFIWEMAYGGHEYYGFAIVLMVLGSSALYCGGWRRLKKAYAKRKRK